MDFEAEGMLEDLNPAQRAARLELLERLAAEGFSPQQLRDAVAENRLALLGVDRVLGGEYSAADIQELTGVPVELMLRIRQALGRSALGADERAFSDADLDAARSTKLFLDAGFDERQIIEISRVLGEGMARLAAAVTASFLDTFLAAGDSEDEVAERFAELAAAAHPGAHAGARSGLQGTPLGQRQPWNPGTRGARVGRRPGQSGPRGLLRRPRRLHAPRRGDRAARARERGRPPGALATSVAQRAGPTDQDDRRCRDVREPRRRGRSFGPRWRWCRRPRRPSSRASEPESRSARRCCAPAITTGTRSTSPAA